MNVEDRIIYTRINLLVREGSSPTVCFFANLAMKLRVKMSKCIPTAATDGKSVFFNEEFVKKLDESELEGVMIHEILHCVLMHFDRILDKDDALIWNIACDLAINPIVLDANFSLPDGCCLPGKDDFSKYPTGLSAEEYYHLLQKDRNKLLKKFGGNPDPFGTGSVFHPKDNDGNGKDEGDGNGGGTCVSDEEMQEIKEQWKDAVIQASALSKRAGKLTGSLNRIVDSFSEPQVHWTDVLKHFVNSVARNDFSWSMPSRRSIGQGIYLPTLRSDEIDDIVVAIDVSGSINEEQLAAFGGELESISSIYNCKITMIYHDHGIQKVEELSAGEPITMESVGGGGTSHVPVFEYVSENINNVTCLICFTDLYTHMPESSPGYPVLWVVYDNDNPEAHFGDIVKVQSR